MLRDQVLGSRRDLKRLAAQRVERTSSDDTIHQAFHVHNMHAHALEAYISLTRSCGVSSSRTRIVSQMTRADDLLI